MNPAILKRALHLLLSQNIVPASQYLIQCLSLHLGVLSEAPRAKNLLLYLLDPVMHLLLGTRPHHILFTTIAATLQLQSVTNLAIETSLLSQELSLFLAAKKSINQILLNVVIDIEGGLGGVAAHATSVLDFCKCLSLGLVHGLRLVGLDYLVGGAD